MQRMKKITTLILITCMLVGCAMQSQVEKTPARTEAKPTAIMQEDTDASTEAEESTIQPEEYEQEQVSHTTGIYAGIRPMLLKGEKQSTAESVIANVTPYTIEEDLSNVENLWQFYFQDEMQDKLVQNGFVVSGESGNEFFEIYEQNRYNMVPNFVTVDSLMHTYHLYFSYLLKNIEKDYLAAAITQLSAKMLESAIRQYEGLKGSEWEEASKRNVAFFTIGAALTDSNVSIMDDVKEIVETELSRIQAAEGIGESLITGEYEDYTQYIPRGYYEGDDKLEQYFRAMMWYGRIHFTQQEEDLDRSALLITKALADDKEVYQLWEGIYAVTSFFAGASDDVGVCEYAPIIGEVYGESLTIEELAKDTDSFDKFHAMTAELPKPQINSIPIEDGEENVISGFRFMGQRFSIDASIMQKLIYSNVTMNSEGEKRMLPDVLDVPAALGSDMALRILEQQGDTEFAGYSETMNMFQTALAQKNETLWSASLYAGWLNTLRPLLTVKGEGYPLFMQNEEWVKKDLECFAGSFAELKHDTILYSKQIMAEMGGGYEEEPDFRGYVQPEPLVYERFGELADMTAEGLKGYGMLSSEDEENLSRLSQMAEMLLNISVKELQNESLTEEEYTFIECYGGDLEHFWYEAVKGSSDSEYIYSEEYPAPIIADIATDPNGTVLEIGTGKPSAVYVVVQVEGKLKIASGSVYSFYQFEWPMNDRLTDSKWRQMMGWQVDENGNYNYERPVERPEWTQSYRYQYEWE